MTVNTTAAIPPPTLRLSPAWRGVARRGTACSRCPSRRLARISSILANALIRSSGVRSVPADFSLEDVEGLAVAPREPAPCCGCSTRAQRRRPPRRIVEHRLGHLRELGDLVEELLSDLGIDLRQHLHELENVSFRRFLQEFEDLEELLDCDLCAVRRHTSGIGTVRAAHEQYRCAQHGRTVAAAFAWWLSRKGRCVRFAWLVRAGRATRLRRRAAAALSGAGGLEWWVWSLRRLWVAVISRHSERAAALPRRWKRSMPRLNLVCPKTGSIMTLRRA